MPEKQTSFIPTADAARQQRMDFGTTQEIHDAEAEARRRDAQAAADAEAADGQQMIGGTTQ